jgi:glutathione S-transferase
MKLYYARPSPYARRVRVLVRERGLLSRVDEIGDKLDADLLAFLKGDA